MSEQKTLSTERQLAKMLNVCASTLANWRRRHIGPPAMKLSERCVRYDLDAVNDWIAKRDREAA